jgi:hypothetical protein
MWFLLQGSIIFAVVASNIHWHWTPNHYLPSLIGFCIALACAIQAQLKVEGNEI